MAHIIENLSRRGVLKGLASAGGLIVAARLLPGQAQAASSGAVLWKTGADAMPNGTVNDPHVFVHIDSDGTVTIYAARAEMGTGAARTSLPMILADELDADWSRVKVVQTPGDEKKYGNQDTDGSRSVRHWFQPMRECGAAARTMLEMAAAKRWGVDVGEVEARNHQIVHHGSGRQLGYGDVAEAAAALSTPAANTLKFKDPASYRYIGKGSVSIVDLHDITTGHTHYGIDTRLPGMKYAVIARPPVVGGKLVSFDDSEAMKVPGVEKVMAVKGWPWPSKFQPLGGVAVIARNTGAAIKGRDALKIVWDDGPNKSYDTEQYRLQMQAAARQPGMVVRNDGDAEAALKSAAKVISAEYYQPHFAHASMEPPCAVADVKNGQAEIWSPSQSPGGTHEDVAKTLELPYEKVKVNTTLLGGGFGRKSKCDFAIEAALLSKELGVPVKVTWTREDDLQHDFYHTTSYERIDAGLDQDGKVIAWRHRSVAPTILSTFKAGADHEFNIELGMGFVDLPFDIKNFRCENPAIPAHVRIGWFRSVSNIPHAFAAQSFIAELAHATGRDPKDMLLEIIGPPRVLDPRKFGEVKDFWNYGDPVETYPYDTGRLRHVAELAAEKAGWGRKLPPGHGMGIAAHRSFLSYVATVVEVAVDNKGRLTVPRVDTAIDCGWHVNPERIASQVEGGAVMGLTLAKYGAVTFKNGRAQQKNFDDYQMVRIDDAPRVTNTYIVPATIDVPSSGVGEPPVPPFAPALCNAIFAATGKRIRELPIGNQLAT
ncbi:MAG: xanthine dehydrogenase family protein molybdopterin-binding subunit [Alphaproteobacteria bacterium]|nr:xanthine dehydrogenase family protein molybdopterin-binding subunit [Alphaproteobacteria bacterium]